MREDSRVVLQAPLKNGARWYGLGTSLRSVRTVVGDTTINTPAGQHDAIEVKVISSVKGPTAYWSEFYSGAGLVKRVYADTLGGVVRREIRSLTDHKE